MFTMLRKNWKMIVLASLLALNLGLSATNWHRESQVVGSDVVVAADGKGSASTNGCGSCWS